MSTDETATPFPGQAPERTAEAINSRVQRMLGNIDMDLGMYLTGNVSHLDPEPQIEDAKALVEIHGHALSNERADPPAPRMVDDFTLIIPQKLELAKAMLAENAHNRGENDDR